MQASRHQISVLSSTAIVAGAALSAANPALAAPATYQAAVTADTPYVYYRQGEDSGPTAVDSSGNGRNGTYLGTPTFGQAGLGPASDTAVSYDGSANEALTANINSFGSQIGRSSYEFIFKVNPGFNTTAIRSLFGVYSQAANLPDVNIDLNSRGNDNEDNDPATPGTQTGFANTTRMFVRGNNADANGGAGVAGHFVNAALYDGEFHHLVFTFDSATVDPDTDGSGGADTGSGGFRAYVDGIEQDVIFTQVNGSVAPAGFSDLDADAAFAGRNVRQNPITAIDREANVTFDEIALYGSALDVGGVLTPAQVAAHATAAGFAVPEPGSLALAGIAGLALLARRRRA
jgi:hypothetical protein